MNIYQKEKTLYTEKKVEPLDLTVFSDIHYDNEFDKTKFGKIIEQVKRNESEYVIIPGDIVNSVNIHDYESIMRFLEKISSLSKRTFIVLGNHDIINIEDNIVSSADYSEYISMLNGIRNLCVLDGKLVEEKYDLSIMGINNSNSYYKNKKNKDSIFIIETSTMGTCFPEETYNIFVCHSPNSITSQTQIDSINLLVGCDFIIAGHTHNGLVPPILERILPRNVGLIDHSYHLFPKDKRGLIETYSIPILITGGITKFNSYNSLHSLNQFYPMNMDHIKIRTLSK